MLQPHRKHRPGLGVVGRGGRRRGADTSSSFARRKGAKSKRAAADDGDCGGARPKKRERASA
eukprot:1785615-Pleurochrysis_carterae.AAC.1